MNKLLRFRSLALLLAIAALLGAAIGCVGDDSTSGQAIAASFGNVPEAANGSDQPTGIWVTGRGEASGPPDLALLALGVQATAETAAEARAEAAVGIEDVMAVLDDHGVAEIDIQTLRFDIRPEYRGSEVVKCPEATPASPQGQSEGPTLRPAQTQGCYTTNEQILIGYRVNNSLSVKVRDLDAVGAIIDGVAEAAGDLIRVDSIRFAIEDTKALEEQARAEAVADLHDKAEQLASHAGVALGPLTLLAEGMGVTPFQSFAQRAEFVSFAALNDSTSVSSGELDVVVAVQGVFEIAPGGN